MARRYWKRMRSEEARHVAPRPERPNPWWDQPAPTLGDLRAEPADATAGGEDQADRYRDWADRLRQRRESHIAGLAEPSEGPATSAGYWTVEGLFEESRRLEREEVLGGVGRPPDPCRVRELLAVLDLPAGASSTEVGSAYRRLAKLHHPDRFVEADADTRAHHAAEMRRIIDAYQALRQLEHA